ncbi:MAG TPA: TraB/GumN family protein [Phenylobacterium sp.]|uniref:TraB/GumN family protein n=1 Tax=Phenylobacterium sp. TaxID=1871053 RepID=UPI002C1484A6|nr:TraB/GumN family protein [Phenylobacterium sp.]HSV03639.1 TraB/GumN family protein [Phenylobacterium sp.]
MMRRARTWSAMLGFAGLLAAAPCASAEPPLWIVKSRNAQVVMFGAVHVLPPGLAWEPKVLKRALAHADEVWFELPVDPATQARTAELATHLGVLPPDQSLFRLLKPEDSARLARVAEAYGVSAMLLDRLQPWLAEIALAGAAYRKAGADTAAGVEQTLAADAPRAVRRFAFETPEEQLKIFADTPIPAQVASLNETLKEMEADPDEFAVLIRTWMAGDVAGLDREALRPLRDASPDLFRRIVVERNERWLKVIRTRLRGRGRTVVVVGVGHLIGPEGLPARLRALGYSVQGP